METAQQAPEGQPLNLSELLTQILAEQSQEKFTLRELSALLGNRTWGGFLLIFAVINILPLPPGTTTITGIPLIILTAQMAAGRSAPWFPKKIDQRGLTKDELTRLTKKVEPLEKRVERMFRPRLCGLTGRRATRVIGAICLLLSILLWLPIPLGNHAPAITMTVFSLALIYRDGVLVILGAVGTILSLALVSLTIGGVWLAAQLLVERFSL